MRCPNPVQLEAFVDGELLPETGAAVAGHVATCPSCTRRVEQTRRLVALLRHASTGEQQEFDVRRLVAAVKRQAGPGRRRIPASLTLRQSVAAAVILLVLGAGTLTYRANRTAQPLGPADQFAQALLKEHQAYEVVLAADPELNVQVASARQQ